MEFDRRIKKIRDEVVRKETLNPDDALALGRLESPDRIISLLALANEIRHHFQGERIHLCAIVNAKSGRCPEDCSFCAQSSHHRTHSSSFSLLPPDEILKAALAAEKAGAVRFGIVLSGRGLQNKAEIKNIAQAIGEIRSQTKLGICGSLGILSREAALELQAAGLQSIHHNLETAESFYPRICSTHPYQERVDTVKRMTELGFRVCSGGLFGLGEGIPERLELAYTLKELAVPSVPLNFLHPIPGTPLEGQPPIAPLEILKTIALFRLILPRAEIRICGGREFGLRTLQCLMYLAGANGTMIGNYLTTEGRSPSEDIQEILDLGFKIAPHPDRTFGHTQNDGLAKIQKRLRRSRQNTINASDDHPHDKERR
jgi:biotin synthase